MENERESGLDRGELRNRCDSFNPSATDRLRDTAKPENRDAAKPENRDAAKPANRLVSHQPGRFRTFRWPVYSSIANCSIGA